MARSKVGAKLSVLKGREAKLNKGIFDILALKGPLIIYDIHKEVKAQRGLKHTKSTNVLRRIKALEESEAIWRKPARERRCLVMRGCFTNFPPKHVWRSCSTK